MPLTAPTLDKLPHWDLSNVYPSLESPEFQAARDELGTEIADLEDYLRKSGILESELAPAAQLKPVLDGYLERANHLLRLYSTLRSYVWSFVSTDSFNTTARRILSEMEQHQVRLQKAAISFQAWLGRQQAYLPTVLAQPGPAQEHAFYLNELAEQSRYLMSRDEEELAAELATSGTNAWGRLQGTVCSQLSVDFERDGKVEKLPITTLQNLSHDPDPDIRKRAYQVELAAWESVREPLAAALNGVKGAAITLHKRRGRRDALHASLDQARIDQATLETMLGAMEDAFPVFRRYLRAKANKLGHPGGLPWYDLFAPLSAAERVYTWTNTRAFIIDQFASFSPRLAGMAQRAFENHWIDAEPRAGKRGGAFCMSVDRVEESRILCNFDGSLDQLLTVAHELGHAFHNDSFCGKTRLQTVTPMTLAETASIFCETLITEAVLGMAASPAEELTILEPALMGATQVIVDISSRFRFEKAVFERREQSELSADDFCALMLQVQKETYGDGLDENTLNPYMWTWKPHYYRSELNFYNFPYAFGLLFGTGLFAIYQQRGQDFVADYEALLASTGEATPTELARRFGIDLRSPLFWQDSLAVIARRVRRYEELV